MRGDGRVFRRIGSTYWWCAYYDAKGVEKREVCLKKHHKKQNKLKATADNEDAARQYLRKQVDAVRAETLGAPAFLGPTARLTIFCVYGWHFDCVSLNIGPAQFQNLPWPRAGSKIVLSSMTSDGSP